MLTKKILPIFSIGLVILAVVIFISDFSFNPGWDFRNNLWAPAHLLVNGQSPYYIDVLFDFSNAIWMPMAIGVFFPIGYLPLQQASNLWWIGNLVAMMVLIWLSAGQNRPRPLLLVLVILLTFLFPPVIAHFVLGQISILIGLIFLIISIYDRKLPPFVLALLLAISLAKPQLAIFALPGYLFSYYKDHGYKQSLRLLGYLFLAIVTLLLPLFIAYPQWYFDLFQNVVTNQDWAHPSLLHWLSLKLDRFGIFIWGMIFLAGLRINFRFWHQLSKREAVVRSLAITPLFTPYIWSWDFVLVLPLLIEYAFRIRPKPAHWILAVGFLSCLGIMMVSKLSGELSDAYFWWVPWYLIGFVILSNLLYPENSQPDQSLNA